jgi:signal transduction histidine kinase/CHASE2 domain-containing sensor protein
MKYLLAAAAACMGVALAVLLLSSRTSYFSQFNTTAYDYALRLAGTVPPASPTTIVAIDDDSLGRFGPWPWTRDKLALLIDRVQAGTPRAIAVDLLLDDRSADDTMDDALAASISRTPHIVLAARLASDTETPKWRKPLAKFLQPHVLLGHVHTDPDFDDISRRVITSTAGAGTAMLAFSLQTLRAADSDAYKEFELETGGALVQISKPINIRFIGGRQSFPQISAGQILEGRVQPNAFQDRIVLIGVTADGMQDQWFTPFSTVQGQKTTGVEIHANAVDTFYGGRRILEATSLSVLLGLFALTFLLWALDRNRRFEGVRFYVCAFLTLPAMVAVSWALMKYTNTWFPFPPFWAAVIFVVPGLEVLEIVRVNRDLDGKIARLSVWDPERNGWLSPLDAGESETAGRGSFRKRLLATKHRNARWRLQAVDFFNEDLVRFLSFNNAILASIEDVIIVSDARGRVVYQNPAARRLDRYSEQPPPSPDYLKELLDGRSFSSTFDDVLNRAASSVFEFVPARDGKRYYHVALAPISKSGIVVSLHDSTALFELNQAKNDMVSLVSHELRTPLTSIRGYTDMLVKYDLVSDKGKPFLSTIIEESGRLNGLIQSFLDVAYIESGRQKVNPTDFEIAPVLRDMIGILGPVAGEKQIRIEVSAESEPVRVRADRLLLYQALSNLVTNAIKYSPSGTTVCLNVSNGDDWVRFHVSDQGCGIPKDETSKVFEKFYRRGNKETRKQTGFGLGLAFVKEVAVKHGGDVVLESEVGKGSTFTLWIPQPR